MKKTLLLVAAVVSFFTVNGADKTWNFSDLETGNITETQELDGLSIVGGSGTSTSGSMNQHFTVENNDKSPYTKRLKTNGVSVMDDSNSALPLYRMMKFNVAGASTIVIHYLSGNADDGVNRTVKISNGTTELFSQNADKGQVATTTPKVNIATYSYSGAAATLYIYAPVNGINFYMVSATNVSAGSSISGVESDLGAVQAVEVYTVTGAKVAEAANLDAIQLGTGIYVVKSIYEGGKTVVSKIVK